jgi:hypothetical protein
MIEAATLQKLDKIFPYSECNNTNKLNYNNVNNNNTNES